MSADPRTRADYTGSATDAAHRVLVDLGQILGSFFRDGIVVVGGLVPDLLIQGADEPHVRSIDIDLALNPERLRDGRYAEIVRALLDTGRYARTEMPFRFQAVVDLRNGAEFVTVDIDFMKPPGKRRGRASQPEAGFRPFEAEACRVAFWDPETVEVSGVDPTGADNKVRVRVTSLEGFLILKAYALDQRDKPKDAYDICYCLDNDPEWAHRLAGKWRERADSPFVKAAMRILGEKFETVRSFGPMRVAEFHGSRNMEERERRARRAFELVQQFLRGAHGA